MRKPRKPKTGRTAGLPAEYPPAAVLFWTEGRCIILARYLFAFIEVSFGSKVAQRIWWEAARRPRQRAIKELSDADMAVVLRYLNEQAKDPQATPNTLARRVAKTLEPEAVEKLGVSSPPDGPDHLRAVTKAVLRLVRRHETSADGYREAVAVLDPDTVVRNIDQVPK